MYCFGSISTFISGENFFTSSTNWILLLYMWI